MQAQLNEVLISSSLPSGPSREKDLKEGKVIQKNDFIKMLQ